MKRTKKYGLIMSTIILSSSVMMITGNAQTVNKQMYNTENFQSHTYIYSGAKSRLKCEPYVAILSSAAADYTNAGKSVTYSVYVDVNGSGNAAETKTSHCFDNNCVATLSSGCIDSSSLANIGCREYVSRLYNNSDINSGVLDSYYVKIYKKYK